MITSRSDLRFSILSCSLDPDSRSRDLARLAHTSIQSLGHESQLLDMRDYPIMPFDNDRVFSDPNFEPVYRAVCDADGVLIAAPIYNWSLGGQTKNVIESTGSTGENGRKSAWFDKVVTFLCAGGLPHSYMAYGATALSLMLDFKCIINPYTVYSTEKDWAEGDVLSDSLNARLTKTLDVQITLSSSLATRDYVSGWEI